VTDGAGPWAKLRRRKVGQWGIVYAAGAWGFLQGLEYVTDTFHWPDAILQSATLALLIGLPVVLVIAWYHGDQGRQRVSAAELTIITLLFLLGGGIFWLYDRAGDAPPSASVALAPPLATAGTAARVSDRSIAVLPFVNMSGDPDNEYFSDGISEEILNVLAGTPELRVAARTSSFSFKGKAMEVPEIADALKVRMVLEGSVRRQGDQVRITAQLIDAQDGFHVWSQAYDRRLEDIFAIQDEIARAIGEELKVKIAGSGRVGQGSGGPPNLASHDLYLRGMALWHTRGEQELWDAIAAFDEAAALDPKSAQAFAGLALAYSVVGGYSARVPFDETVARARNAAEMALALDPTLPEAYAALGNAASYGGDRQLTSIALLKRAIDLRPSFATAHQWLGTKLMTNGDLAGGLASLERASTLDPRSPIIADNHASVLLSLGRNEEARARCLEALDFAPTFAGCLRIASMAGLYLGDYEAARPLLERFVSAENPSAGAQATELVDALAGSTDRQAFARRISDFPINSNLDRGSGNALAGDVVTAVLMLLGERELALDYLERLAGIPNGFADWTIMLPVMDPIRCEPRFVAVVERLKTTDPHAAKVCAVQE
jgi:TolB-like protein/tetratricopeptide (TPR) repeat protein